jgi:hypothetical protein
LYTQCAAINTLAVFDGYAGFSHNSLHTLESSGSNAPSLAHNVIEYKSGIPVYLRILVVLLYHSTIRLEVFRKRELVQKGMLSSMNGFCVINVTRSQSIQD